MNFCAKLSFKSLILVIQILLVSVLVSSNPVSAQIQYQYPTLSVNPSNVVMYTPITTINVALSSVTGLNALHFIFSFNDQGSTFLSVPNGGIALGTFFTGTSASLSTNIYYLSSTGRSYVEAIVEMPGNTGVSSTTTKNVLTITLHLLPTAIAGLQSNLKIEEADALFTSSQYIDEAGGLTLQSGTLTVGYLTTIMTTTPATTTVGNTVTLTSTLQDSQANPLAGLSINYNIGSQSVGTAITDASGISSVSYTPSTAGTFTINAMYVGNQTGGTFASSSATATLTVNPQNTPPATKPTSLSLNVPQSVTAGVAATVQATLTQGSSPLSNANIFFSATPSGGSSSSMGSATTNSNGVATLSYSFSTAGSYTVQAQFLGDTNNDPSKTTGTVNVNAATQNSLISTTLTLNVPSTAKINQQVSISSILTNSNHQPLPSETINYETIINGVSQPIGFATTDSKGSSSIPFVPLQAQIYQIKASYGGSTIYSPSDDSQSLSVNTLIGNKTQTTITLNLSSNKIISQTFVTISAALKDQSGGSLAQENIVYQFSTDGIAWNNITSEVTSSDGVAQTNYKPDQTGTIIIRALFDGDANYYQTASGQETLTVSNETSNSTQTFPWIWISVILAVVAIVIVAVAFAVTRFRSKR